MPFAPGIIFEHNDSRPQPGVELYPFAAQTAVPRAKHSDRLVITTYNLRYGRGAWLLTGGIARKLRLQNQSRARAQTIRRNLQLAARAFGGQRSFPPSDIIALQEADNGTTRAGGVDVAQILAAELGFGGARVFDAEDKPDPPETKQWYLDFEEPLNAASGGNTGIALLSGLPFEHITPLYLPASGCLWRPRVAVCAQLQTAHGKLLIATAHIDPHAGSENQLAQHDFILQAIERAQLPTVYLGDFNSLTGRARRDLRTHLRAHDFHSPLPDGTATWRAGAFTNHTDWIFTRGVKLKRWGVARSVRHASDHYPVWAELDLTSLA